MKLKGQSALVTGATTGIGKAAAFALAEEGCNVMINHVGTEEEADRVAGRIRERGGEAVTARADISDEAQVTEMFSRIRSEFGTMDILVNNAGIQQDSGIKEMSLEKWQKVLDVNLTGHFLCAREAAKEFTRRGVAETRSRSAGKIVFISSVHEVIPWAGHANYTASKGGIRMLARSLAQELGPDKIRVNAIAPGAVKTPINKSAWQDPEKEQKVLRLIPYGRWGVPEDIARAVVWLCTDDSDYVTGTTLFVDGGMMLYPGFSTTG